MSLCGICGGKLWNQPLKITKWGHFEDSKWSRHKIKTLKGARDFFGPLKWHQQGPFWGPKKSRAPLKVKILSKGPFWILEMAPFCDFQRVYYIISRHIYSTVTVVILCRLFSLFRPFLFLVFKRFQGREIGRSTLFCKVRYVPYSDKKFEILVLPPYW